MMRSAGRRLLTTLPLFGLLGASGPARAEPVVGATVFAMVGTGTLSPGYPTTGCLPQTQMGFTGTVFVAAGTDTVGNDDPGGPETEGPSFGFSFSGSSSICETVLAGQGSGTATISSDDDLSYSSTVFYTRTDTVLQLSGTLIMDGVRNNLLTTWCAFVWTSANPSVTYEMNCVGAMTPES